MYNNVARDNSLFASVMDYLAVEKGWFSPYLYASGRRPVIPRSVKPDVVFCHGPFLSGMICFEIQGLSTLVTISPYSRVTGDYKLGETLLAESALVISFAKAPQPPSEQAASPPAAAASHSLSSLKLPNLPNLTSAFSRSRTPSPEPALAPLPPPPQPRRLVVVVVGLKPHRTFWTTSQRPSESVIQYQLLNGCPAIVVPAKVGAPLLAWDTLTLEQLWKVALPAGDGPGAASKDGKFEGIASVLYEYLDLCIDWDRVVLSEAGDQGGEDAAAVQDGDAKFDEEKKREAVKSAVTVLVAAAVRSGESKEVKDQVDKERSGIAMWRIP